jgi:hypothetical protein
MESALPGRHCTRLGLETVEDLVRGLGSAGPDAGDPFLHGGIEGRQAPLAFVDETHVLAEHGDLGLEPARSHELRDDGLDLRPEICVDAV